MYEVRTKCRYCNGFLDGQGRCDKCGEYAKETRIAGRKGAAIR